MFALLTAAAAACLAARPCDQAPLKGSPLCNEALPVEQRAEWIVSQLTLPEKINLTQSTIAAIPRLGLPAYNWINEALHGVAQSPGVIFQPPTPFATSFPQVCLTGASFNKSLWGSIGSAVSTEARAMNNAQHAGLDFWTPNVNIFSDPRWGRGQEVPGEDPYVTGAYAEAYVAGLQEGEDPRHLKVSSCCKHYYAYNMELFEGVDRHIFNAVITPQDEADTFFPAFHSCVRNAKVSGLMCSYNAVNGVPSCANKRIMNEIARDTWGFDGYITSDCGAVQDLHYSHNYDTPNEAVRDSLTNGMDSNCGAYFSYHAMDSINANVTLPSDFNTPLVHLFSVQIRLGMFDSTEGQPYLQYKYSDKVNTPEHQALAVDAARQGSVLLKNDGALPFSVSDIKTVAVVGPSANATLVMQASYYGIAPFHISPVDGVSRYAKTVLATGCVDTACNSTAHFQEAVDAAAGADATVMVMGLSVKQEAEALDRTDLEFPGQQEALIARVAAAAKGPVVVVVFGGGPVDMTALKNNPKVRAVLWMGYPGQAGGQALAELVFGDVNPSGRLPHTQYPKDYVQNFTMFDMNLRPNATRNNPGRTYRFYTGTPVYPYGAGLSYTTFAYNVSGPSSVSADVVAQQSTEANVQMKYSVTREDKPLVMVTVRVRNTGSRAGDDAVIIFMKPPTTQGGAPLKFVVGFDRAANVAPGDEAVLEFPLYYTAFSLVDEDGKRQMVPGTWTVLVDQSGAAALPINVA